MKLNLLLGYFLTLIWQAPVHANFSTTPFDVLGEIQYLKSFVPALKLLTDLSDEYNVEISLSGYTAWKLVYYAYIKLEHQHGDLRYQKSKLDDHYSHIFTYHEPLTFDVKVSGLDPKKVSAVEQKIQEAFFFLKVRFFQESAPPTLSISLSKNNFSPNLRKAIATIKSQRLDNWWNEVSSIEEAIYILTLASRFELSIGDELGQNIRNVIDAFDFQHIINNLDRNNAFQDLGKRIFLNSINLQHTYNLIKLLDPQKKLALSYHQDRIGRSDGFSLRDLYHKAILIPGDPNFDAASPTADKPMILTHQTATLASYASITRSPMGIPQAFVSRQLNRNSAGDVPGELARRGDGYYMMIGMYVPFKSEYGPYMVLLERNPSAIKYFDYRTYGLEFFTLEQDTIRLLEVPPVAPLTAFKILNSKKHDARYKYYRHQWRTITELAFNPQQRERIDQYFHDELTSLDSFLTIDKEFLKEYLKLPNNSLLSQRNIEAIKNRFAEAQTNSTFRIENRFSMIYKVWLESKHALEHRDFIAWHINNPLFNGTIYLPYNFRPYIYSSVVTTPWFIDIIKRSSYKNHILELLNELNGYGHIPKKLFKFLKEKINEQSDHCDEALFLT